VLGSTVTVPPCGLSAAGSDCTASAASAGGEPLQPQQGAVLAVERQDAVRGLIDAAREVLRQGVTCPAVALPSELATSPMTASSIRANRYILQGGAVSAP
jgi:hypothetical protein